MDFIYLYLMIGAVVFIARFFVVRYCLMNNCTEIGLTPKYKELNKDVLVQLKNFEEESSAIGVLLAWVIGAGITVLIWPVTLFASVRMRICN